LIENADLNKVCISATVFLSEINLQQLADAMSAMQDEFAPPAASAASSSGSSSSSGSETNRSASNNLIDNKPEEAVEKQPDVLIDHPPMNRKKTVKIVGVELDEVSFQMSTISGRSNN